MSDKKNVPWMKPVAASSPVCPGPTSESGKATSSRNALKHGCCAIGTLLLDSETIEDFKALEATWCRAYNPQNDAERHLVAELVNADWLLQRVTFAHAQLEVQLYAASPNSLDWTEAQERKLGRHLRYKTAQTNLVNKARKAIEDYRKTRLSEKLNQEKLSIAQERLKATQKKNRPEPTWKEHLANMRQQAISLGFTPPDLDPTKK